MTKRKPRLAFRLHALALTALAVAVALCWIFGVSGEWTFDNLLYDGLDFGGAPSKTFSLENGTQYGVLSSGPNYSLTAGTYRLSWTSETDAENAIRITTGNGARVEPKEMVISPDNWTDSCEFTLLDDAENLQIQIVFARGSYLKLHDMAMSFDCTDGLWMLTLLTAALFVWYWLERRGWMTRERKIALLLVGAAVLVSSVPALRENLNAGHDSEFHRMRLRNVVSALSEGQFPVRVGGSMYNGYSSATSIFYPDYCLYIPALLMMSGATIQFALSVLLIGVNAVTAGTMYACGKRIFASSTAGMCAAILYTLVPYRLTDVYTRMALGEAAAMAVIPLFVLGLWEVIFGEKDRWPLLSVGAAAVFLTHMLSTVLCAAVAAVVGAACLGRIAREKRLIPILKAIGLTVLLCAFYLAPLLDYMLSGMSMGSLNSSVSAAAMEPMYLFASDAAFPRDIGPALLAATAATLYALIGRKEAMAGTARALLVAAAVFAFMTTKLFPWGFIEQRVTNAVNFLQFPWRLLMFVDLFLALACGYGLSLLGEEAKLREGMGLCALAVCLMASSAQISQYTVADNAPQRYWLSNSYMISAYSEYTLPGSNVARTVTEHEVLTTGDAAFSSYGKRGTHVTAQVSAEQGGSIEFPVFAFDGYKAELDGQALEIARGDNNRIRVEIPADVSGTLHIWFAGKTLWRIADAISLLAAAGLCACLAKKRRNETRA